tara:strand:+ start:420 stop:644 length:225 start_codon:yes stop_codon:yes gene_type:complete
MSNEFDIGLMEIQKDFESEVLTIIMLLNQNGLSYEAIKHLIELSVDNCLNNYDNNREFLTKVYKKLEKEYQNNE